MGFFVFFVMSVCSFSATLLPFYLILTEIV